MKPAARITMLNSMAGKNFHESLGQQKAWSLSVVDLKSDILGKALLDLTDDDAMSAKALIDSHGMAVECLSSGLFHAAVEQGETYFREHHMKAVERLVSLADIFEPHFVRLLAANTERRAALDNSIPYIQMNYPWLFDMYRESVKTLSDAGHHVTLENEVRQCILSGPTEVLALYEELDCGDGLSFTWDVQNMWQMGTFPSLEVYEQLKDLVGYFHLKGGQAETPGGKLRWRSCLEDASWPVLEITRQAVADHIPALCLNPSHGEEKPGYDYADAAKRDLDFIRTNVEGVA